MGDLLKSAIVYVPAFLMAKAATPYVDPLLAGWIACGLAMGLRYEGPDWIRWKRDN